MQRHLSRFEVQDDSRHFISVRKASLMWNGVDFEELLWSGERGPWRHSKQEPFL